MKLNKMKELNKKTISTIIITILMLSMVIALPMANAVVNASLVDPVDKVTPLVTGSVGTEVLVKGEIDTMFGPVEVYWDDLVTKIGEGYAIFDKSYAIEITIPEDSEGDHYVIVKDTTTSITNFAIFAIEPKIVLSPLAGIKGDPITVTGTGFTESTIALPIPVEMSLTGVVEENVGTGDGTKGLILGEFELDYPPETPASVAIDVAGTPYTYASPPLAPTEFSVDAAGKLLFFAAPGDGDLITADYEFTAVPMAISPIGLKTNSLGSFTGTFTIPLTINAAPIVDNTYTVKVLTGVVFATETLKVGTVITLAPKTGLTGTTVTIDGRGFTPSATVDVKWHFGILDTDPSMTIVSGHQLSPTGSFTKTITVPPIDPGKYILIATDSATPDPKSSSAIYDVTGVTKITLVPTFDLAGETISVNGEWFTGGKLVTIYFDGTSVGTETAAATGMYGFTKSIVIPVDATLGAHTVKAMDSEGVYATATFNVIEEVITIETKSASYDPGDTISFTIESTVDIGTIVIEVYDPDDHLFWLSKTLTPLLVDDMYVVLYSEQVDIAGHHLTLPSDATLGTWEWTATYTVPPDTKVTDTFIVGEPSGPQPDLPAETTDQVSKDSTGAPKTSFVLGETVLASAKVTNTGTQSQSMLIIVQWTDPQLRALAPVFILVELGPGQSFTYAPGLILPLTGYATGTWTAKVLVLDTWPAQGGVTIGAPVTITITVS